MQENTENQQEYIYKIICEKAVKFKSLINQLITF